MLLVCGEDGTHRRAIWSTEGLSPWRSPRREDFVGTDDARRLVTAEPGVHELEEIPNTTAARPEVDK